MKPDVFARAVEKAMDGYQWNARKRKSPVNLPAIAAMLLRRQHAAIERVVRRMPCMIARQGPGRPCQANKRKDCTISRADLLAALKRLTR